MPKPYNPLYDGSGRWPIVYHLQPTFPDGRSPAACFGPECWRGMKPLYPAEHHFASRGDVKEAYDEYWADMRKLAGYFKHVSHLRPS